MDARSRLLLSSNWWVLTIRGIAAILFGLAAVFWPGLTLVTLVYLFSAYILVSGIVSLVHGVISLGEGLAGLFTLLLGFVEIGVGVYLLRHTNVAFSTLILLIGFTLIVRGVLETVAAFGADPGTNRTLLMVGGLIAVLTGIVVLAQPVSAGVTFVWVLGIFALVTGPMLIALSMEARAALDDVTDGRGRRAGRA